MDPCSGSPPGLCEVEKENRKAKKVEVPVVLFAPGVVDAEFESFGCGGEFPCRHGQAGVCLLQVLQVFVLEESICVTKRGGGQGQGRLIVPAPLSTCHEPVDRGVVVRFRVESPSGKLLRRPLRIAKSLLQLSLGHEGFGPARELFFQHRQEPFHELGVGGRDGRVCLGFEEI